MISCCPRQKVKVFHKLCLQLYAFLQQSTSSAAVGIERTGSGCVHGSLSPGWVFFLQLQGQTHTSACVLFLTVTKAGCLKGNLLPLWQALSQLFAGLRGGRGTFTHPFSQGRYSPSLPIKSHFLHSMHELQPHQYIRYCG